jgi:quercetin dioxygenase-like cupin family protein
MTNRTKVWLGGALGLVLAGSAAAEQAKTEPAKKTPVTTAATTPVATTKKPDHIMVGPGDVKWVDGPPNLPAGAKVAILEGDPSAAGPFTIRMKAPANYKIMPHTHPGVEHVTVLEGNFSMGLGGKWDEKSLREMGPGGFMTMEVGTQHYAACKGGCTIQLHGIGPWGITYVNPADDPSKKPATPAPAMKSK